MRILCLGKCVESGLTRGRKRVELRIVRNVRLHNCVFFIFQLVKRRLYRLLRSLDTDDWPKYFQSTVTAINNTPNSAIGFLKPSAIHSNVDDPKIDNKMGTPQDIRIEQQKLNQKRYEKNKKAMQVGDYVYLDFPTTTMQKGFDSPVNIYVVIFFPPCDNLFRFGPKADLY